MDNMDDLNEVNQYLLTRYLHNLSKLCKELLDNFIVDPKPLTINDLKPLTKKEVKE